MVELQACVAGFDETCSPLSKLPVLRTLPHRNTDSISDDKNVRTGGTDDEEKGSSVASGGVKVAESIAPLHLERATSEDDHLSPSAMDLASLKDGGHLSFHQQLCDQQQQAVEGNANFAAVSALSQDVLEQNGHSKSGGLSGRFLENARLAPEGDDHHSGPLLYPPMPVPGPSAYFQGVSISEVYAELECERRKNAELQERISILEARLGINSSHALEDLNETKKSRKRRTFEKFPQDDESEVMRKDPDETVRPLEIKEEEKEPSQLAFPLDCAKVTDTGVTWMSRDYVTAADLEKLSKDIVSDRDDSMDSDDDDDDDDEEQDELDDGDENVKKMGSKEDEQELRAPKSKQKQRGQPSDSKDEDERVLLLGGSGDGEDESDDGLRKPGTRKTRKLGKKFKSVDKRFTKKKSLYDLASARGIGNGSVFKKNPKTAFCPKEVKGIMESGVLGLQNAQSHTMRKIIVFASLGIRHGCEDLYDLDFGHFSVIQRGEPYKSAKDPGEHVLYEQPGGRRKIFYPNRLNPILCPVRILDEELAMRPGDASCPTCLFLCIKYGGRTRNLPQNEYVRQRMGRNKLKSFGPLMCQMALLVHVRTGSFFFKALGITLLFMAGFPDDLVRKETKYRNLDLLQKYYRSDEDAKDEQLFHPFPSFYPQGLMVSTVHPPKTPTATKVTVKRGPTPILSKPPSRAAGPRYLHPMAHPLPTPPFTVLPPPFTASHPSMPAVLPTAASTKGNPSPACPPPPLPPFGFYSPYPPMPPSSGFPPMAWTPVNSYPPSAYPPVPYGYQSFPNFPAFYGPQFRFPPQEQQPKTKEARKEAESLQESDSDTDSRASGLRQSVDKLEEPKEKQ